jgi:hypothetical protein
MSVHVTSVDPGAKNVVRSKVTTGILTYVAKVKLLAALPVPTKWTELYVGYLALSSAGERGFLSLFDCEDYSLLMCHELYYKFTTAYAKLSSTIYAFPVRRLHARLPIPRRE